MLRVLDKNFFCRPALEVGPDLLGKYLVRRLATGQKICLMITEVEVYDGQNDLASHAARGRTARNEIMFAAGGVWYVYLCYGLHHLLNVVTGKKDYPAAILIRGAGEISGPGRLTRELRIDRRLNGRRASRRSPLWLEDRGVTIPRCYIKKTPRIGVDFAGPIWSLKPYRLIVSSEFHQPPL